MDAPIFVSHPRKVVGRACPVCARVLDGVAALTLDPSTPPPLIFPEAGDITVCLTCGTVLVFTDRQTFRVAEDREVAACDPAMQTFLRAYQASRASGSRH